MEPTPIPNRVDVTVSPTAFSFRRVRLALPVIAAVFGVWLVRDVAANIVGGKGAQPRDEAAVQNWAKDPFVMTADALEPVPSRPKLPTAPPSRSGLKKRVLATSDETPFVAQETVARPTVQIQEWLSSGREWPTNRVQVGDVVYPREALVSQILKGSGSDPSLALAQQVALARLKSTEEQLILGAPMKAGLANVLAEADSQLRMHPPGSAVQGETRATILRIERSLAAINLGSDVFEARQ